MAADADMGVKRVAFTMSGSIVSQHAGTEGNANRGKTSDLVLVLIYAELRVDVVNNLGHVSRVAGIVHPGCLN